MEIGVGIGVTQFDDQFEGELQNGHTYAWTFDSDKQGWTAPGPWSWTESGRNGGGMMAGVTPTYPTEMSISVMSIDPAITSFTLSAYLKTATANPTAFSSLVAWAYDSEGGQLGEEMTTGSEFVYVTAGEWQQIQLTSALLPGTAQLDILLRTQVPNYDHEYVEVFWDDVSLTVS